MFQIELSGVDVGALADEFRGVAVLLQVQRQGGGIVYPFQRCRDTVLRVGALGKGKLLAEGRPVGIAIIEFCVLPQGKGIEHNVVFFKDEPHSDLQLAGTGDVHIERKAHRGAAIAGFRHILRVRSPENSMSRKGIFKAQVEVQPHQIVGCTYIRAQVQGRLYHHIGICRHLVIGVAAQVAEAIAQLVGSANGCGGQQRNICRSVQIHINACRNTKGDARHGIGGIVLAQIYGRF